MRTTLSLSPRSMTRTTLLAPALALLVLASGCGSDSDSSTATAGGAGSAGKAGGAGNAGTAGSSASKGGAAGKASGGSAGAAAGSGGGVSKGGSAGAAQGGTSAGGTAGNSGGATGGSAGASAGQAGAAGQAGSGQAGTSQGGANQAGNGQGGAAAGNAGQAGQAGQAGAAGSGQGGSSGAAGAGGGIAGCCSPDAKSCPDSGDRCVSGVCVAPAANGACWVDGDCGAGNTCEGEYVCPCGAPCQAFANQPGKCTPLGLGCCQTDESCTKNGKLSECVNGTCKETPAPGTCWDSGDCNKGQTCEGESVCPCGADCLLADVPGKCVDDPPGPGCCKDDSGCEKAECTSGVCKPIHQAGTCWDDGDCGKGERCDGETVCACGAVCPAIADAPGKCVPDNGGGCCLTDAQCGNAGAVCVAGVCKDKPAAGACWRSDQCADGLGCEGGNVCSCFTDGFCPGPDAPGKCVKPANGCCKGDDDCGSIKGSCVNGACVAAPKPGQCWDDSDCAKGSSCEGEFVCPCGALCGIVADHPGTCSDPGGKVCCKDDKGCKDTEECVVSNGLGVCKTSPDNSAACWDDGDCVGGKCAGAQVCGCAQDCLLPDALGKCVF